MITRQGLTQSYQYPEKESNLKSVLKKDEMDQEEDDARLSKPKVLIGWYYNQISFYGYVLLCNLMCQLGDYMLKLGSNSKKKLKNLANRRGY